MVDKGLGRIPLVRKLTITLEEEDWRKFIESNPEPIQWIIQQIKNSIRSSSSEAAST